MALLDHPEFRLAATPSRARMGSGRNHPRGRDTSVPRGGAFGAHGGNKTGAKEFLTVNAVILLKTSARLKNRAENEAEELNPMDRPRDLSRTQSPTL